MINCVDEVSCEKLKSSAALVLGKNYEVKKIDAVKPKVKMIGFRKVDEEDDISTVVVILWCRMKSVMKRLRLGWCIDRLAKSINLNLIMEVDPPTNTQDDCRERQR